MWPPDVLLVCVHGCAAVIFLYWFLFLPNMDQLPFYLIQKFEFHIFICQLLILSFRLTRVGIGMPIFSCECSGPTSVWGNAKVPAAKYSVYYKEGKNPQGPPDNLAQSRYQPVPRLSWQALPRATKDIRPSSGAEPSSMHISAHQFGKWSPACSGKKLLQVVKGTCCIKFDDCSEMQLVAQNL